MFISEEDRQGAAFKERARRYKWVTISQYPYTAQVMVDWRIGWDVTWQWRTDGFFLTISDRDRGYIIFSSQIPNWEMAEIEDVVDSLVAKLKE